MSSIPIRQMIIIKWFKLIIVPRDLHMELDYTRRLQLINHCAFVSLPKAWMRAHKLEKGDKMRISLQDDGSVRITPLEAM